MTRTEKLFKKLGPYGKGCWYFPAYEMYKLCLLENYKVTNTSFIKDFVDCYYAFLDKKLNLFEFEKILIASNFRLIVEINSKDPTYIRGELDKFSKQLTFIFSDEILKKLEIDTANSRERFRKAIVAIYVHEDTHRQQIDKYFYVDSSYKNYTDCFGKKLNERYFNQQIEADAYGRQVGEMLQSEYPEESIEQLFERVLDSKVENKAIRFIVDNYRKNKLVTEKNRRKFFRALYDYLDGEADDEESEYVSVTEYMTKLRNS